MERMFIGVDLGGTKLEAALVSESGTVLTHLREPTDVLGGPDAIVSQIATLVAQLQKQAPHPIEGVGVGIPGQLDPPSEIVRFAPNLKWENIPLKAKLTQRIQLPIAIDNDVRVATRGEWLYGAGKGIENFVCVFLGTGVGGGIVLNGKLLQGSSNTAGELGHMTVNFDGPLCSCGNPGCLEAYIGGWAIAKKAQQLSNDYPDDGEYLLKLAGGNREHITAVLVSQANQAGDPLAQHVVMSAANALLAWSVGIVHALNPQRLIFGGGLLNGFPDFVPFVQKGIKRRALAGALASLEVVATQCQGNANLLGAAALISQTLPSLRYPPRSGK